MQGPKAIDVPFYGDVTRWFVGKVVNHTGDPLQLGRVQVRIIGIHDNPEIEYGVLPWATVMLPTTESGITYGRSPKLMTGAQVFGIFLDGKQSQLPMVLGSIPHILVPSSPNIIGNNSPSSSTGANSPVSGSPPVGGAAPGPSPETNEAIRNAQGNGNTYEEQIFNFFVNLAEYSNAQIAGILGNLYVESAGFAEDVILGQRGDGSSKGIGQWLSAGPYDRWTPFLNWAGVNGYNPYTVDAQMRWVAVELDSTESRAKTRLLKTSTPEHAAIEVMRYYERPEIKSDPSEYKDPPYDPNGATVGRRAGEAERVSQAIRIYNTYGRG